MQWSHIGDGFHIARVSASSGIGGPIILLLLIVCSAPSYSIASEIADDALAQDLTLLREHPADDKLREAIIRLAKVQRPIISASEAQTAATVEGQATYMFKHATGWAEMLKAAHLFELDSLAMPWKSSYYYNGGLAYEQAGLLVAAIRCFHFYLLAAPSAPDALGVSEHIGELQSKILSDMHPADGKYGVFYESRIIAAGKDMIIRQSFDCVGDCGQQRVVMQVCHSFETGMDGCYSKYLQVGVSWPDSKRIEWNAGMGIHNKRGRSIHLDLDGGHMDLNSIHNPYLSEFCPGSSDNDFFSEQRVKYERDMLCNGAVYTPNFQANVN